MTFALDYWLHMRSCSPASRRLGTWPAEKANWIPMMKVALCLQSQNAEQIHPVSSTYSESHSTGQFRQRPSLCSWVWNMVHVLEHLCKKTISFLSQPQSHTSHGSTAFLPRVIWKVEQWGRLVHELTWKPRVGFILSLGLCFPIFQRTCFFFL